MTNSCFYLSRCSAPSAPVRSSRCPLRTTNSAGSAGPATNSSSSTRSRSFWTPTTNSLGPCSSSNSNNSLSSNRKWTTVYQLSRSSNSSSSKIPMRLLRPLTEEEEVLRRRFLSDPEDCSRYVERAPHTNRKIYIFFLPLIQSWLKKARAYGLI